MLDSYVTENSVQDTTFPFKLALVHNKEMFYIDIIILLMQPSLLIMITPSGTEKKKKKISSLYSEYTAFPNFTLYEIFYLYQNPINKKKLISSLSQLFRYYPEIIKAKGFMRR